MRTDVLEKFVSFREDPEWGPVLNKLIEILIEEFYDAVHGTHGKRIPPEKIEERIAVRKKLLTLKGTYRLARFFRPVFPDFAKRKDDETS